MSIWSISWTPIQKRLWNRAQMSKDIQGPCIAKIMHEDDDNFFNEEYVVHWEFFPEGKTVSEVLYNDVKERLLKKNEISEVSPVLFKRLVIVIQCIILWSYDWKPFLDNRKAAVLQYPPYSPAHTPVTYYHLPKLKFTPNGWHFKSIMENEDAVYKENEKHYKRGLPRKDKSLLKYANWCSPGILKLPYPVEWSEFVLVQLCNRGQAPYILSISSNGRQ